MTVTTPENVVDGAAPSEEHSTSRLSSGSLPDTRSRRIKYKSSSVSLLDNGVECLNDDTEGKLRALQSSVESEAADMINTQRKRLDITQDYLNVLRREVDEFANHQTGIDAHELLQHKIATFSDLVLEMPNQLDLPKPSPEVYIPPCQTRSEASTGSIEGSYENRRQLMLGNANCLNQAVRNDNSKNVTSSASQQSVNTTNTGAYLPPISLTGTLASPRNCQILPPKKVNLDLGRNTTHREQKMSSPNTPDVVFNPHPRKLVKVDLPKVDKKPPLNYKCLPMSITRIQGGRKAEKITPGETQTGPVELFNVRGGRYTREQLKTACYDHKAVRLPLIQTSVHSCLSVKKLEDTSNNKDSGYIQNIAEKNTYSREMIGKYRKKSQVDLNNLPVATRLSAYDVLPGISKRDFTHVSNKEFSHSSRENLPVTPRTPTPEEIVALKVKKIRSIEPTAKPNRKHQDESREATLTPTKSHIKEGKKKLKRREDKRNSSILENVPPVRKLSKYDVLPSIPSRVLPDKLKAQTLDGLKSSPFMVKKMSFLHPKHKLDDFHTQGLQRIPTPPATKKPSTVQISKHRKLKNAVQNADSG